MNSSHTARVSAGFAVLILTISGVGPTVAEAAAAKHHDKRPPAGKWRFSGGDEGEKHGHLQVTKGGKKVKNLSVVPPKSCAAGRATVLGSHAIKAKGEQGEGSGDYWHVGASTSSTEPVTVKVDGAKVAGQLFINIDDTTKPANAAVMLSWSANCNDLTFQFEAPKKK